MFLCRKELVRRPMPSPVFRAWGMSSREAPLKLGRLAFPRMGKCFGNTLKTVNRQIPTCVPVPAGSSESCPCETAPYCFVGTQIVDRERADLLCSSTLMQRAKYLTDRSFPRVGSPEIVEATLQDVFHGVMDMPSSAPSTQAFEPLSSG